MPHLWLDHAWFPCLQNALRRREFDAVAELAFEDVDQGPRAAFLSGGRAIGLLAPCHVNTGVRRPTTWPAEINLVIRRSLIADIRHIIAQQWSRRPASAREPIGNFPIGGMRTPDETVSTPNPCAGTFFLANKS